MVISDLLDNIRLLFVSEKKPFLQIKAILGFLPHNIRLYELALKHKSVNYYEHGKEHKVNKEKKNLEKGNKSPLFVYELKRRKKAISCQFANNERLEFLGDAVLSAIVADILYRYYGNKQEGFLTNLRSKIVCRNSLNKLAADIGLDALVKHTGAVTTAHNSFMNGNAFEAFLGAVYLDRGYRYCYRFLEEKIFEHYINIDEVAQQERNFKSMLIEWCQKRQYKFEFFQKEAREDHNRNVPVFHSYVCIEGIPCGTGNGYSKKESDQSAAKQALKRIKSDKNLLIGIKKASAGKSHHLSGE